MNAMNWRMWKELKESFEVVNKDPSVRCIILGSTSNHFSTGMDLSVFAEMVQSHHKEKCPGRAREKLENTIDFFQSTCTGAEACNVPVICAIDGNAIGGAVDLLTACCLRYCTKQANFSVKEIDLAIVADVGTLQRLPNIVGEQRTRELAYTGRHFNGEEAMNLGLKMGIDKKKLADIMNTSTARCWSSDTYNPCPGVMEGVPASRGYEGGFGSALMQKDLGLVMDAGKTMGTPLPMGASAHQLYSFMSAHGAGQKDFGALFEFLQGTHMK